MQKESRATKTEIVLSVIRKQILPFGITDIKKQCPAVSIDMIRHLLKQLKTDGKVKCTGRGKHAKWENIQSGNNS